MNEAKGYQFHVQVYVCDLINSLINCVSLMETLSKLLYLTVLFWCSESNVFVKANNKLFPSAFSAPS